jgi:cyclophilin family peptidyl-prolyl cis-trans isomerase
MNTRMLPAAALFAATGSILLAVAAPCAFAQAKPEASKPAAKVESPKAVSCADALKANAPLKAKLTTSMGPITLQLDKQKAPISTENFAKYVDSGAYNGTIFHRVIDGFMIQGGGFTKDMAQKPTNPPIKNEAANGLKNDAYTVAMARTGVRDSATSQFFINVKNNDMLNYTGETQPGWGYAVFGKVIEGQDTVDKIRKVATGNHPAGHQNVPLEAIVIEKAECF